ncbi:MAG: permease prefix domain 1-containing protein [Nocardioides sp.]
MGRVDDYLSELAARLRLTPASARRLVDEAEAHLQDAVDAEMSAGVDAETAEARALARFGTPQQVARAANGGPFRVLGPGVRAAAQLVAVGCVAVVAGALLSEALSWVTSTGWVFGRPASFTPTAGQVSHWLAVQPGATSWRDAAARENASDILWLRGLAGVLGLLTALALHRIGRGQARLGGGLPSAIGATAFGGAAVLLLSGSLSALDWGRGQALCDGLVAAVVAACYAVACARTALTGDPVVSS